MRMASRIAAVLFVVVVGAPLFAQPSFFGAPFPLTNTRYGAQTGRALVRSNGVEPILFWEHFGIFRAARLVDGENQ